MAPGEGTLCRLAREGDEIELGGIVAAIATSAEELSQLGVARTDEGSDPAPAASSRATHRAIELAAERGVDLGSIAKPGFITAADVEAAVASREPLAAPVAAIDPRLLDGVSLRHVSLPDCARIDESVGVLDPSFVESLRADPAAFRELSSEERCDAYRQHGAQVGDGVRLGERTLIVSPRIVLGDGVEIGDDSLIRCDDVFCVGPLTMFLERFRLRCRRAFFGACGYVGEDVQIGGGGTGDPQALFVAGDLLFIGAEAFVNPCRPVLIGREVFLTMRSVLVTHNVGHSVVEGFENRFAPIVLEDRTQVGIGAVVYAGCRIGRGAIVASSSYVVSDIPPDTLAIGVPARAAGKAHRELSEHRRSELARRMLVELRELLELGGHDVAAIAEGPARAFTVEIDGRSSQVLFVEHLDGSRPLPGTSGETVVLALHVDGKPDPSPGCSVLDLLGRRVHGSGGVLLETVREFCRKRGIRFEPGPWRYGDGLI